VAAMLALVTLLLAPAQSAAAPPPRCQAFTRDSREAPPAVREWLARSGDERVRVCSQPALRALETPAAPVYSGEGAVTRHGAVCSFASHGLSAEGSGAAQRLRRYDGGEALAMTLAQPQCPPPHPDAAEVYVLTYETSPGAFVSIMQLWSAVAISVAAYERELACCDLGAAPPGAPPAAAGGELRQRLHAAIAAGEMRTAAVTRIVRIPGSTFRRRYALFVADPQRAGAGFYVVYVRRELRGASHIIGVGETD